VANLQHLHIVTLHPFEPDEVAKIKAAAPNAQIEVTVCRTREEFHEKVKDADVVFGDIRAEALESASKLKWVQAGGAGLDASDPALLKSSVLLTNFAATFAPAISETAIGMLLCLTRGISKYYVPQFLKREWKPVGSVKSEDHAEISGRTMGIVGLGGIGSAVARRAHYGFDMRILAIDSRAVPKPEYVAEVHDLGWFHDMIPQVDVLVAAAPLTAATECMFNERVFRAMKTTAYFLALSRGKLFDDLALVKALQEGWIAGAGLDVFPMEPPPSSHPIFDCTNVVMTAHTSGWSPDRQTRLIEFFVENVRRYAEGLPLLNVVDKNLGY
jgi:phosphoglycerate dehydrogenase-like enzyme